MTSTIPPATDQTETTEPAAPLLRWVDPETLLLDGNVRLAVDLDKAFLESIRDEGVLQPITARLTTTGELRVRYGERRTLSAIKVGLCPVPVWVTDE